MLMWSKWCNESSKLSHTVNYSIKGMYLVWGKTTYLIENLINTTLKSTVQSTVSKSSRKNGVVEVIIGS